MNRVVNLSNKSWAVHEKADTEGCRKKDELDLCVSPGGDRIRAQTGR